MKGNVIIREIAKVILIMFFWSFPIWMWRISQNGSYLWFFILSFVLTCATFTHYEVMMDRDVDVNVDDAPGRVTVDDLYPKRDERES